MYDRRRGPRFVLIGVLWVVFGAQCPALAVDGPPEDPIDDSDLRTTTDLLRGFSDAELDAAEKAIPRRPEPSPGVARPRAVTVTGHVYQDQNANGAREPDEPGLADVTVTDGRHVLRTSRAGGYRFRIQTGQELHHRFVVVTRPTGYRPTGEFFLRVPFDEERTDYSVDFGLAPDAASANREFWFVTASDSQFTTVEQMIPTAKDYAQITSAPNRPAFMMTAGDLTMSGSHFEWDMYDHIRRSSKIPVHEGFGGHDGNCLDPRSTLNFEQRIGPPYYSWDYGGVHFVQFVTETAYLRPAARERQTAWLKADLGAIPPKTPVIVVSHYPLAAAWFDQRLAEGVNVVCQIAAHWHVVQAGSRRHVPVLITAPARGRDWGAYSRTYRWVHVTPDGIRSSLRVTGQYKRLQMVSPGPIARVGRQPLVVLAYDTALLVKSVECRWISPNGTASTTTLRQRGDWSWHGPFEPDVPGRWKCTVEATDIAGSLWSKPLAAAYAQGRPLAINNTPPVPTRFGLLVSDWQKPQRLLDYSTGEQKKLLEANVGTYASFATVFDDVMYCVRRGGGDALKLPQGEPLWKIDESSRSTSAPIVVDGKLIYSGSSGIRVRDASTGNPIWQAGFVGAGYQNPVPVVWDELLLVNGEDFRALDLKTGKTLWTVDCAAEAGRFVRSRRQAMAGGSTPIVAGDLAWFGHDDTSIRAVNRNGDVAWEHVVGTPVKTGGVITGNLLLIHDFAGNLWCFAGT